MNLNPDWLEGMQLVVRLILTLLCTIMINMAIAKESNERSGLFVILIGLGSALLKMVSSRIFGTEFLFAELALFMVIILAISILAGAQIVSEPGQIYGLKMAGAIWMAGAIGLAMGSGYYFAGIFTAVLSHFILVRMKTNDNSIINQNH